MSNRRLFYALWPSDPERNALAAAAQRLYPLSGRAVATADLHVTLAFVGSVDSTRVDRFVALNRELPPASLTFDMVEHWPKPRVLVATTRSVPATLQQAVDDLWQGLDRLGVARESRPFRPHVTLARDVSRWRGTSALQPVTWTARQVVLFESRPDCRPRYQPLAPRA
jgi:2'-5' RNA ligase